MKSVIRFKNSMTHALLVVIAVTLFWAGDAFATLSTRERCEQALKMMGVETGGTERGWASLCAGIIKNEPITRYGNWYGPGYWGGSQDPSTAGMKPPLDSLDAIAQRHDYGYLVAEKYGKIYGKKYEYKLKAIADKIAVEESMSLPEDPRKWDKPPADIDKAGRYRDRIITGFIIESDLYKDLANATKVGDTITSPVITIMDETDYSHIPDAEKMKREVASYINGWKKDVADQKVKDAKEKQVAQEKKAKEEAAKAKAEKEKREAALKKKLQKESDEKRAKDAEEAKKRLEKKIAESKKDPVEKKKTYNEMTPEERKAALMANDDEAWKALGAELKGETEKAEGDPPQDEEQPKGDPPPGVKPVRVSASGSFDEDYSANGIQNIVTTTFTVSFWNVGSAVPGYGAATMKSKSISSLNGSTSETTCGGTFSGGPNGVIRLGGECDGLVLGLKNGSSIPMDEVTLKISNPAAFRE